ncbi:glycoside hydrolase family 15 protein [Mycetohabitans sp. B5]|uniref:Trehalase n=1 Tax=Mycetohabitans endofungorum TaxID=417203 RepID=A0A2P5KC89_9BURK|nr:MULTISPECIES: glycoside hydrolase family 15 protein [Mycetohabitans]MCG1055477.1 glycoside hydrolase family 15 protein [Mycetohabitans sp. B5]PPB84322.1 GH15 family glucan-1,4-alpha-glucosidase [Mycetohabitans endofungorum]
MPRAIEDYALIGDGHTAALVGRDGSIDWLCWPRFDSGACFAALLGTPEHGRWLIAPYTPDAASHPPDDATPLTVSSTRRRYRGDTLILETDFETPDGAVTLIDFMPSRSGHSELVRIVVGQRGAVRMRMELVLRFDYGYSVPWVSRLDDGSGIRAIVGPDMAVLRTPVALHGQNMHTVADFTVRDGERIPFVLAYAPSHERLPAARDPHRTLARTESYWCKWSSRCTVAGRWAPAIRRSLITLRALAYEPTGGIVAAPTTSLPEYLGGTRNWDYRYTWLRDATITLLALMRGGYYDEACAWRAWLGRVMAGSPTQLQIMYGIGGERRLPEWEASWLPGYEDSRPVRLGNNAVGQLQLDVYGEVMNALHLARVGGLDADETAWSIQCEMVNHLEKIWTEPDEGIWEVRGGRQHFTFSKVMAWVACDRILKSAERFSLPGPLDRWRRVRDEIHAQVCACSWNPALNAFAQSYRGEAGGNDLDASVLLMPLVGFLPPTDPRVRGTVEAIDRTLSEHGLIKRYHTSDVDDGLPPGEGTFLACSFWMVDNLVLQGRLDEAHRRYERLLSLCNDVGLLSEEYDTNAGRMVGNFPQAFSHVALVHTGLNLMRHEEQMAKTAAGDDHSRSALDAPQ